MVLYIASIQAEEGEPFVPVRSASGKHILYFDCEFFDGEFGTPMNAMTAFILNLVGRKIGGYDIRLEELRDFAGLDRMNAEFAQAGA